MEKDLNRKKHLIRLAFVMISYFMSIGLRAQSSAENICLSEYDSAWGCHVFTKTDVTPVVISNEDDFYLALINKIGGFVQTDDDLLNGVTLELLIDTSGNMRDVRVKGKKTGTLTELEVEILKFFKYSSHWSPATCIGRKVMFKLVIPVHF